MGGAGRAWAGSAVLGAGCRRLWDPVGCSPAASPLLAAEGTAGAGVGLIHR